METLLHENRRTPVTILAIDPGSEQSAFVLWNGEKVLDKGILPNEEMASVLANTPAGPTRLFIEMIAHYGRGMPAGKETFDTCIWIGDFRRSWGAPQRKYEYLLRATIKAHLCGSAKAKDANVSQALRDRFGKPGTKKNPGILYGVTSHCWAALALAVCAHDRLSIGMGA